MFNPLNVGHKNLRTVGLDNEKICKCSKKKSIGHLPESVGNKAVSLQALNMRQTKMKITSVLKLSRSVLFFP
jgi:hypothetical protein